MHRLGGPLVVAQERTDYGKSLEGNVVDQAMTGIFNTVTNFSFKLHKHLPLHSWHYLTIWKGWVTHNTQIQINSWPLNNMSLNYAGPLIHGFPPNWSVQFKPVLFKDQLCVWGGPTAVTAVTHGFSTELEVGAPNSCVVQGSTVNQVIIQFPKFVINRYMWP